MSIIKCTECGKKISEHALNCTNCGCPMEQIINEHDRIKKEKEIKVEERKLKKKKILARVRYLLECITGVTLYKYIKNKKEEKRIRLEQEEQARIQRERQLQLERLEEEKRRLERERQLQLEKEEEEITSLW